MTTFDATDDYVTCARCGMIRPVVEIHCVRCALGHQLTVERFRPIPRLVVDEQAVGRARLRQLADAIRGRR